MDRPKIKINKDEDISGGISVCEATTKKRNTSLRTRERKPTGFSMIFIVRIFRKFKITFFQALITQKGSFFTVMDKMALMNDRDGF